MKSITHGLFTLSAVLVSLLFISSVSVAADNQEWDKTFSKSDKVISEPADSIPKGLDPISSEFWEYYAMARGHHPRSHGPFTATSNMAFMNFPLMNYIDTISPRPILFIMGENAHSRYFTEDAYGSTTY